MRTEGYHCFCLSLILIASVFKIGKNCYHLVSLEECKYIVEKRND